MSRYPNETTARFDQQFAETSDDRNERLRKARNQRQLEALWILIADLSGCLTDEGVDYSEEGLVEMRRRAANALPPNKCPEWLEKFRDPPIVQS